MPAVGTGSQLVNSSTAAASGAWFHNVVAGTDILLVRVVIRTSQGGTSTTVVGSLTYAGIPCSPVPGAVATNGLNVRVEFWYLLAPPVGNDQFVITLTPGAGTNGAKFIAHARSLSGAAQSRTFGTAITSVGNASSATLNAEAGQGDTVFDCLGLRGEATLTVGAGQVSDLNSVTTGSPAGSNCRAGQSHEDWASGTTVTRSWTISAAANFAFVAVAVKDAGGQVVTLDGTASGGASAATGAVSPTRALDGSAGVSGSSSGGATLAPATFDGSVSGSAAAAGSVAAIKGFAGSVTGRATVPEAELAPLRALLATATVSGLSVGDLVVAGSGFDGSATGSAAVAGALAIGVGLKADAPGEKGEVLVRGFASGALDVVKALDPTASAISGVSSGAIVVTLALASSALGQAATVAAITVSPAVLAASALARGLATGAIERTVTFSGSATCTANATGAFDLVTGLVVFTGSAAGSAAVTEAALRALPPEPGVIEPTLTAGEVDDLLSDLAGILTDDLTVTRQDPALDGTGRRTFQLRLRYGKGRISRSGERPIAALPFGSDEDADFQVLAEQNLSLRPGDEVQGAAWPGLILVLEGVEEGRFQGGVALYWLGRGRRKRAT